MITTFFPFDANPDRLERLAREHAEELDLVYGSDSSATPVHRLIVNYLRHECTDYDLDQSRARHRAACEAIGRRFPWLAEECERQIARRAAQDAREESDRQALAEQEHALGEERRALVARRVRGVPPPGGLGGPLNRWDAGRAWKSEVIWRRGKRPSGEGLFFSWRVRHEKLPNRH